MTAGLDPELKEKLLDKFSAPDRGECPICLDVTQAPVVTSCAHGPFCLECITQNLQHQVRLQALEFTCNHGSRVMQESRSMAPAFSNQVPASSKLYAANRALCACIELATTL